MEPVNFRGARMGTIQKWSTATVLPPGQANIRNDRSSKYTCDASVRTPDLSGENTYSELLLDHHGVVTR